MPNGPGYGDISHQTCTVPGAIPGTDIIPGDQYVLKSYDYNVKDLWRNFGLILVILGAFLFLNMFLSETLMWGAGGKTVTYFAKESKEAKELNNRLGEKRNRRKLKQKEEKGSDLKVDSKSILTWENLCYDVPGPSGGQLRLLKDIFGFVRPGQLTALM